MIEKPFALVASAGRTGTGFFGERLVEALPEAHTSHEPEVLRNLADLRRIRELGLHQMIFGKLTRTAGMRNLSVRAMCGRWTSQRLARAIVRYRKPYFDAHKEVLMLEASLAWFGLLHALPYAMRNYRVAIIIRDPRSWITSCLRWRKLYGPNDYIYRLGLGRLSPRLLPSDPFRDQWAYFNTAEKLAWYWRTVYAEMVSSAEADSSRIRVFRFEDIFPKSHSLSTLPAVVEFLCSGVDLSIDVGRLQASVARKSNASKPDYNSHWSQWPLRTRRQIQTLCGPLMLRFNYGTLV